MFSVISIQVRWSFNHVFISVMIYFNIFGSLYWISNIFIQWMDTKMKFQLLLSLSCGVLMKCPKSLWPISKSGEWPFFPSWVILGESYKIISEWYFGWNILSFEPILHDDIYFQPRKYCKLKSWCWYNFLLKSIPPTFGIDIMPQFFHFEALKCLLCLEDTTEKTC